MTKQRVPISSEVAAQVLHEADRTCCVCREPSKAIQIHHIDGDPSNNSPANLAVLCLEQHNDTEIKGGFGRKLDAAQINLYKAEWIATVAERKQRANELVIQAMAKASTSETSENSPVNYTVNNTSPPTSFKFQDIESFVRKIPTIVKLSFAQIDLQDNLSTAGMISTSEEKCSVLGQIWIQYMALRRNTPSNELTSYERLLDQYRKVTSQIDAELEYPNGFESYAGSMQRLHDAHNRFIRMSHLIETSVEHHFRDEFGGTDDSFASWLSDFRNAY